MSATPGGPSREGATPGGPWLPTVLHARALTGGLAVALLAVLLHRPDLVVLAAPLLAIAVWSAATRPRTRPATALTGLTGPAGLSAASLDLMEGQAIRLHVHASGTSGADTVGHELGVSRGMRLAPEALAGPVSGDEHTSSFVVQPTAWGPAELATGELHLRSAWGAFDSRWSRPAPVQVAVAPSPGVFDADAPVPHPSTMLGVHPGHHRGDGSEFDDIREFHPGDRPRRVHWPTSARTGRLHVRTTYTENDTEVLLLVDGHGTIPGAEEGSLSRSVHAAASVAAWCTRTGDRVGLRVLGTSARPVLAGSGRRQLLRILGTLARLVPDTDRSEASLRMRVTAPPGSLVVVLTPLTERRLVDAAAEQAAAGLDVLVVDTAPVEPALADRAEAMAWRVLQLERERTTTALARRGVAVAPWRGAGTLDAVLASMTARRARVS